MRITDLLSEALVLPSLKGQSKEAVLRELAESAAAQEPAIDAAHLLAALHEREQLGSTAIGAGIAIPHGKISQLPRPVGVFGRHRNGIDFQSLDGVPTTLFFMVVAPMESPGQHLKALAQVARLLQNATFRQRLMNAADQVEIYRHLREADAAVGARP